MTLWKITMNWQKNNSAILLFAPGAGEKCLFLVKEPPVGCSGSWRLLLQINYQFTTQWTYLIHWNKFFWIISGTFLISKLGWIWSGPPAYLYECNRLFLIWLILFLCKRLVMIIFQLNQNAVFQFFGFISIFVIFSFYAKYYFFILLYKGFILIVWM